MENGRRLDFIDGLRGIAALAVVFQHAIQLVQDAGRSEFAFLLANINLGRFGVVLFFLISGCVIPFSFKGERPLRNFALSRFFRLYPAYWLSLPVLTWLALMRGTDVTPGMVLGNVTMMQGFWSGTNIGEGYWTLYLEMVFYLLCALLFWLGWLKQAGRVSALAGALLIAALLPVALDIPARQTPTPYYLAVFLTGLVLRQAYLEGCRVAARHAAWLVPMTVLTGAIYGGLLRPDMASPGTGGYFNSVAMVTGMVLPVVLYVLVLRARPAMSRPTVWLGAISYSVYLFQDVGLCVLPRMMSLHDHPFLYVALVFAVTIGLAALIHRFAEQPMIALGRWLTHRARQPEQALAAS